MKTLITHINPHLDDIAAIWLFKKFHSQFADAKLEFISADDGNKGLENSADKVYFGVGRGKFDEHKGDIGECATSLVWKDVLSSDLGPKDEIEKKAYQRIVEWVRLDDTGKMPPGDYDQFNIPAFIRLKDNNPQTSAKSTELGAQILDRILNVLKDDEASEQDWQKRLEFDTKFGKSFAIKSDKIDRPFCRKKGGDLFLINGPKTGYVQFFTPRDNLDLEPLYTKLKEVDKAAGWFLHQSHHILICGSGSSPDSQKTSLSFEQLIEVVKSI